VNLRLESRVRENRSHGSEGGGAGITGSPYPYIADTRGAIPKTELILGMVGTKNVPTLRGLLCSEL